MYRATMFSKVLIIFTLAFLGKAVQGESLIPALLLLSSHCRNRLGLSFHEEPISCATVLCQRPICKTGEELVTPDGKCCPECQLPMKPYPHPSERCAVFLCARPLCKDGEREVIPKGQCCAQCVPDEPVDCPADAKQCPDGSFVGRDGSRGCDFKPCPPIVDHCSKKVCHIWIVCMQNIFYRPDPCCKCNWFPVRNLRGD